MIYRTAHRQLMNFGHNRSPVPGRITFMEKCFNLPYVSIVIYIYSANTLAVWSTGFYSRQADDFRMSSGLLKPFNIIIAIVRCCLTPSPCLRWRPTCHAGCQRPKTIPKRAEYKIRPIILKRLDSPFPLYHHQSFLSTTMKLSVAFKILGDISFIFTKGVLPTIKCICNTPLLLFKPAEIRRTIMSFVWVEMGDGIDQNGKIVKTALITPNAYGVVLDLGSGKNL